MTRHAAEDSFGKDERMIVHEREPFNAEPPADLLRRSFVTPTSLFYVRNHAPVPDVGDDFALRVEGGAEGAAGFTVAELRERFPAHEVTATLQCAGNRRDGMAAVAEIAGEVPWRGAAAGTALWRGVRLADVLRHVGVDAETRHVRFDGADRLEKHNERICFGASVEIAKALADEVLLAFEMNGEALTPVHGAPLRVVVPGYIGARSVKWLERIELAREPSENYYQQKTYRVYPSALTQATARPADGIMLGALSVNSCVCLPDDVPTVAAGRVHLEGYATAGGDRAVARVEVSTDAGRTWQVAEFEDENSSSWAWRFWSAEVALAPGAQAVAVRAWDSAANTQPASAAEIWNCKGYMNNAWHVARLDVRA